MRRDFKTFASKYLSGQKSFIYVFSFMVFFWTIFDSIMQYVTPLIIEERGFSNSMIGLILGSSSIAGAIFDFLICKIFKNTNFKKTFLVMFVICAIYPLLLWQAKTIWFFIFVMAVWGLYFDLYGFGTFNFIGRYTKKTEHAPSFGLVQTFRALGGILAPFIVGLLIVDQVNQRSVSSGWIFLAMGFIFFTLLIYLIRKNHSTETELIQTPRRKNLFIEFHLWRKLGKLMMPVLCLTFYLFFIEAFFWTLAPLYAETTNLGQFGGMFLAAFSLPALIVGWFVGTLTKRFGKKKTALAGLLVGSLILSFFVYSPNSVVSIFVVFLSSLFISMALPAINAAYADYISEATQVEGEIESLEDFAFNIGYVLGPITAGILADLCGMKGAFSILGIFGAILAIVLLVVTPKSIIIKTKSSEL
ncbi:MAG TPA: MFS transporter [Patescibacteria group bacterium]|nr:MFS transporter [Patescibacteria group bacterium]